MEITDIFLTRGDAHLELRPKFKALGKKNPKLDCNHWCQRSSLWAPFVARLQESLEAAATAAPKSETDP